MLLHASVFLSVAWAHRESGVREGGYRSSSGHLRLPSGNSQGTLVTIAGSAGQAICLDSASWQGPWPRLESRTFVGARQWEVEPWGRGVLFICVFHLGAPGTAEDATPNTPDGIEELIRQNQWVCSTGVSADKDGEAAGGAGHTVPAWFPVHPHLSPLGATQDLHSFSHWQPWAGSLPTLRPAASVPRDAAGTQNGEAGGPGLPSQLCPWPAG